MYGAGAPLIPQGSEEVKKDAAMPENPTGGTYEKMLVNAEVMKAMQEGSIGDFVYFAEWEDGLYEAMPKLPEYGAETKGGETFKLRENNNRLVKGIASRFLNRDGEVDFAKGVQFIGQLERYLISEPLVNLDDITMSQEETFKAGVDWLCEELMIPEEERKDFSGFCHAAFAGNPPAFAVTNFSKIWKGWARNGIAFQEALGAENSVFNSDPQDEVGKEAIKRVETGFNNAVQEIKEMAKLEPVHEMRLFTVTECSGSAASNVRFAEMARNANERTYEEQPETYNIKIVAPEGRNKDDLKWDEHYAPALGTFKDADGNTYYVTIEAFAPESDMFMEHPGMTSGLAMGIYKDEAEFQAYYRKDDGLIEDHAVVRKIKDEKITRGEVIERDGFYALEETYHKKYKAQDSLKDYLHKQGKTFEEYREKVVQEQIGWELDQKAVVLEWGEMDAQGKRELRESGELGRTSVMLSEASEVGKKIPQEHRPQYHALKDALGYLNKRMEKLEIGKQCYEMILNDPTLKLEGPTNPRGKLEWLIQGNQEKIGQVSEKEQVVRKCLKGVMNGDNTLADLSEREKTLLTEVLAPTGYNLHDMRQMAAAARSQVIDRPEIQVSQNDFAKFQEYIAGADRMSREQKTAAGEELIERLTGVYLRDHQGKPDLQAADKLLSQVCINGIPYRAAFADAVDGTNYDRFVDELAGRLADQMNENSFSMETITLLSGDKMKPILYQPEQAKEPTNKPGFFSSSAKKAEYEAARKAYEAQKAHCDRWEARNTRARENCERFTELRKETIEVEKKGQKQKVSFAELAESVSREAGGSRQRRNQQMEQTRQKKLETSMGERKL